MSALIVSLEFMQFSYFFYRFWEWIIHPGLPLAALLVLSILIPRVGRLVVRIITQRLDADEESTKSKLALVGALVYVVEAIAFFIIAMRVLTLLGVPATSAAIPATVVSAAIGFGAQNIIGDFLSGVFIITERQFGVGDYVSFDGPNQPIEGTVVALTLRATKVRTASGELVTIPNGTAGVITNYSQEWSRAWVEMDLPMQPGEDMVQLTKRIHDTTTRAVEDQSIKNDVIGDLSVLPAIKVVQPLAAGQPWAVTFRITADVVPAKQWAVERTIRAALLNAFWDRLEFASDATRESSETKRTSVLPSAPAGHTHTATGLGEATQADHEIDSTSVTAQHEFPLESHDGQPNEVKEPAETADPEDPAELKDQAAAVKSMDDGPGKAPPIEKDEEEDEEPAGIFDKHEYNTKIQQALTFGGRTRVSTSLLLIALVVLGGLALASSNPEGGEAGVLNPNYWQNRSVAKTEEMTETTTTPPPAPTTTTPEEQPTETSQEPTAEPTGVEGEVPEGSNDSGDETPVETTPSDAPQQQSPGGNTAPRAGTNSDTEQQTAPTDTGGETADTVNDQTQATDEEIL